MEGKSQHGADYRAGTTWRNTSNNPAEIKKNKVSLTAKKTGAGETSHNNVYLANPDDQVQLLFIGSFVAPPRTSLQEVEPGKTRNFTSNPSIVSLFWIYMQNNNKGPLLRIYIQILPLNSGL